MHLDSVGSVILEIGGILNLAVSVRDRPITPGSFINLALGVALIVLSRMMA